MNHLVAHNSAGFSGGVRLEDINLSFGKTHVLKAINLEIKAGEFFAFLNLDAKLRIQMRLELRQLQRKLSLTTIFVTHDQVIQLVE